MRVYPLVDESPIVKEMKIPRVEVRRSANRRKLHTKLHVSICRVLCAGKFAPPTYSSEPFSNRSNRRTYIVVVRTDILAADIGAENVIAIGFALKD